MDGPWDQFRPQTVAATDTAPPWDQYGNAAPQQQSANVPRGARTIWDDIVAGYQGSATGLLQRGKLPDVVLDPSHAKWYDNALAGASSVVSELPEMVAGGIQGGLIGSVAGPIGTVAGAGAGTFALPTLIRTALIDAYTHGEATSSADFLNRAGILIKETGKSALVGAATSLSGMGVARVVGGVVGPMASEIGVKTATRVIGAAQTTAEIGAMTVAPAALEGRMPEPEDFANAAIMVAGMKAAGHVAGKIAQIYAKTGVRPEQVVVDAKADPVIGESLKAPTASGKTPEIPAAYNPLAEAEMLKGALPEAPKVAEIIANPVGVIPEGKQPNHINYAYIEAPQDVLTLRARLSEVFQSEINAERGKESWATTAEKANKIITARLAGMSDAQRAELQKSDYSKLAADSMAAQAMADKAAFDVRQIAAEISAKGELATPEDFARQIKSVETAALLHQIDQGNGAEIARALNARKAASQRAGLVEGMNELLKKYNNDPHTLSRLILGLHTTEEITKFAKEASKATTFEKVVEAWKSSILSGPFTYVRNIIGNTSFLISTPFVDAAAAAWGTVKGVSAGDRVSLMEPVSRVTGNLMGVYQMARLGVEIFKLKGIGGLADAVGGDVNATGKSEQFRNANTGAFGKIVRVPFNLLSSADTFFKTMVREGEAYALATRDAAKKGLNPATREYWDHVTGMATNPDAAMTKAMDAAALRQTYQAPLGKAGQAFQDWVTKSHMQFLFPFIRTPTNILKETFRLTPLAPIIGEWRADIVKGGIHADKAMAELAVGTAFMGAIFTGAMNGIITGAGDPDPNKRRVKLAAGWQPYSVKVGNTYYSYQGLGPITTVMGMAADAATVWDYMDEEESDKVPKILAVAFANAVTNQTALMGMTNLVNVTSDPTRYGPTFFRGFAGSVVPALIAQPTAALDPIVRQVDTILDAVKARIPGLRQTLLPKVDAFGEDIQSRDRLIGVSPITESTQTTDKVRSEADRLGVGVAAAPKNIQLPAANQRDIGKVELTPEQKNVFAHEGGRTAYQILDPLVNSEAWDAWPDMMKKRAYDIAIKKGREIGALKAVPIEQRLQEAQRIAEQINARMAK